jgi:hypothetical protein
VGIVNGLEPYLTHRHITVSRFDSFTRQIEVDWHIPAHLEAGMTDALKKDGRFVVVTIKSKVVLSRQKQLADQINAAATGRRIPQNLADFVDNTAKDHDLDVVILVVSFNGESPWRIQDDRVLLRGYGLFTRHTLLGVVGFRSHWVHPYAQIVVAVFQTRPVSRIGAGRPSLTRGNMDSFNWPADIKKIPQAELDKLRPRIQEYADQAVKKALRDAHLISF